MRTEKNIRARLNTVLAYDRLAQLPATTRKNKGLAIIQLILKTECDVLQWVLTDLRNGAKLKI